MDRPETTQTMGPKGLSGLTAWQIVKQSWLCHPDWSVDLHIAYLQFEEDFNLEHLPAGPTDRSPQETITRWITEFQEGADVQ